MEDNFIGYLLNALDERSKLQVESYLLQNPDARAKLALLKQALEPLAADREAPPPPADLVERTLARVAAHVCASNPRGDDLPQAPPVSAATLPGGRSWWRRADLLVAASLLLTFVGVSVIALQRMRGPSSAALVVECKNNLREFFVGLDAYRQAHNQFPNVAMEEAPRDVAGMVVPILNDAGTLPESASIRCPGVGAPLTSAVTLAALRNMDAADFALRSPCLSMCYAYSLGYRQDGAFHGPGDALDDSFSQTPIMADRPPAEGILSNSINHGGNGQNVLFADGHVHFLTQRELGADQDIFLNNDRKVAAGLGARDFVLGYSAARSGQP